MGAPGRRSLRLVVFLLVAGGLSAFLVAYAMRSRPPALPADADHPPGLPPAACLTCHGPGARNARSANHPLNDQCFNCHAGA